jgi:hypothetical protein
MNNNMWLAAAWTPDGRSIVLTSNTLREGRPFWQLRFFDLATGAFSAYADALRPGAAYSIKGWLGVDPVVGVVIGDPRSTLERLAPDGTTQVLTSAETYDLQIPQDLVGAGRFGGPPVGPQVFAAERWAYGIAIVVLTASGFLGRAGSGSSSECGAGQGGVVAVSGRS